MSIKEYLAVSGETKTIENVFESKATLEEELAMLSKRTQMLLRYVKKHGLKTDLNLSAALCIVHGVKRSVLKRLYGNPPPKERYMEIDGKYYIRTKDMTYLSRTVDEFIGEDKLEEFRYFVDNILNVSEGKQPKYTILRTVEEVESALKAYCSFNKPISMDIETSGLDPYTSQICGIGLAKTASGGVYIPLNHISPDTGLLTSSNEDMDYTAPDKNKTIALIKEYFPKMRFICHNAKFEYSMFKVVMGIDINIAHCTMLGEYAMDERLKYRYNLGASVAERFTNIKSWKESKDFVTSIMWLPPSRVGRYCVRDCCYTYLLYLAQYAYINKYVKRVYYEIDLPYLKCAADAELTGFDMDEDYITEINKGLVAQQKKVRDNIIKAVGHEFDIASSKQLREVLFEEMGFTPTKTTTTGYSTDRSVLTSLLHSTGNQIFQDILDYRLYSKLISTYTLSYLDKLNPVTGRIHPSYMLTTTVTGRISCTDPNLQNIPKQASDLIRTMFLAPEGQVLLFADYSSQEIRVLAALSNDETLIQVYNPCYKCTRVPDPKTCKYRNMEDKPGECKQSDVHSMVASKIFKEELESMKIWEIKSKAKKYRNIAKAIDFSIVYGSTVKGIADKLEMSLEEAQRMVDEYFTQFPGVKKAIDNLHTEAMTTGQVKDLAGRVRHMTYLGKTPHDEDSPFYEELVKDSDGRLYGVKCGFYGKVAAELRQAQNFPMQGTSASMTKEAAVKLRKKFKNMDMKPSIMGFIHDEIIIGCVDDAEKVKEVAALVAHVMTKGIRLTENYGFPEELPIEVEVEVGYNWGKKMSLEAYLEKKALSK